MLRECSPRRDILLSNLQDVQRFLFLLGILFLRWSGVLIQTMMIWICNLLEGTWRAGGDTNQRRNISSTFVRTSFNGLYNAISIRSLWISFHFSGGLDGVSVCPWTNETDGRPQSWQAHKRTNDFARVRINRDWPLGRFQNREREREWEVVLI